MHHAMRVMSTETRCIAGCYDQFGTAPERCLTNYGDYFEAAAAFRSPLENTWVREGLSIPHQY